MSFFAIYPALGSGGGGGSGITSINGDTTAAQFIVAGTGISVSSVGGTTTISATGGGGTGTVTSVSVVTANGVSGSVATATTTPAITLTLGAITPTSVNASGTLAGSNFSGSSSGTNTGDQTITLTGDVTGSGTGSFAATISANAVTNAKLAQMPAHTIKGNNTAGTANALDLTATQVTAELNQFTTTLQGVVPGSGGGTANFLRADGTWATPPDTTGITQLTGDVTAGPGSGSQAASLVATTNATLTTLSGLTSAASLATVGTITTGVWNGTTIAIANGGTGQTTQTAAFDALAPTTTNGDLIYYNGADNIRLPIGSSTEVLTVVGGIPAWASATATANLNANIRASEGAGTTTLTNADKHFQTFDLSAGRNVDLPTTGVLAGDVWVMTNPNPFTLQIRASDSSNIIKSYGTEIWLEALINTPVTSTDWKVSSRNILYLADRTDFTPTFSGNAGSGVTFTAWAYRIGPALKVHVGVQFGSGTSGNFGIATPFGLNITASEYKLGSSAIAGGIAQWFQSPNLGIGYPVVGSPTNIDVYSTYNVTSFSASGLSVIGLPNLNAGDFAEFEATVLIDEFKET